MNIFWPLLGFFFFWCLPNHFFHFLMTFLFYLYFSIWNPMSLFYLDIFTPLFHLDLPINHFSIWASSFLFYISTFITFLLLFFSNVIFEEDEDTQLQVWTFFTTRLLLRSYTFFVFFWHSLIYYFTFDFDFSIILIGILCFLLIRTFSCSNFSCMYLNPNIFFQFEF